MTSPGAKLLRWVETSGATGPGAGRRNGRRRAASQVSGTPTASPVAAPSRKPRRVMPWVGGALVGCPWGSTRGPGGDVRVFGRAPARLRGAEIDLDGAATRAVPGDGEDDHRPDDDAEDQPLRQAEAEADGDGVEPRRTPGGEDGLVVAR